MNGTPSHVIIVGAGHAGGSAAAFLRQFGWKAPITLIGEESALPYQRPPLSKALLKGEATEASLLLRPAKFYADQNITVRLGTRAVGIDRQQRTVTLENGEALAYSHLIVATGAGARRMSHIQDIEGVLYLRTSADAERIRQTLQPGATLVVVGGGYVGLEVAATARRLGLNVVVIEREPRLLARVASQPFAKFIESYFRTQGVQIELGCTIESFESHDGKMTGVRLSNGRQITCTAALIGIGANPNDELMRAAGILCGNGVTVDQSARTSDESIFAIGDCTNRPLPLYGTCGRLESVPNALEQAKQAASAICQRPLPKPEVPWFWSDQFDLRIQIAGLRLEQTESVIRGDPDRARFAVFHLAGDNTVRAVEAINASVEFMAGKQLIAQGKRVARDRLSNATLPMQEIAA
ncbi:ferredoxin reductase [Afipia sp. P52-10]|uniref:NAD(P)/FAD-dependent oxidoreductase n=1 Tax=Afipia sp. P52-10 TaxID=1429916 RepID=UPI0003DF3D7D|nr:FAD-dependent oxidoreductase [Afipia sp. P52-10]ETR76227.1 ferredoxin reductase [Afipia sp. P52-10]